MADLHRTIRVDEVSRIEGEGALHIRLRDGDVASVRLEIYEPPRFFEGLVLGRSMFEVVDIVARICGICPVAHQLTAAQAIERACGVRVDGPLGDLRRLLYLGERIQSHALHIYLLHAPDFLGYDGATEIARDHPGLVARGLSLKKAGAALCTAIGGRAVHPVNVRLGGFHRIVRRSELVPLIATLDRALDDALATVRWVSGFDFPALEVEHELVALRHDHDYPVSEGRIVSSGGLDIAPPEFPLRFPVEQIARSTGLATTLDGRPYLVGPLARFTLDHDQLPPAARAAAIAAGLPEGCRDPFRSIVVRALEVVAACEDALRLLRAYEEPPRPHVEVAPRVATGHGVTEAPRGLLYHRYSIDDGGRVTEAAIVTPTGQDQAAINADLRALVRRNIDVGEDALRALCERAIRNHDPCISCATHFLRLEVER